MSVAIRWGILGTGAMADEFALGLRLLPDATLSAVGSRTAEAARAFAARHGIAVAHAHGRHEELVSDPEVDIVYVATPNSTHAALCLLALDAGKPVLCEKPFAPGRRRGPGG